jgi:type II secretory pathway component PulF
MGVFGANELSRARFYDDLSTSLDAGLGAREALTTLGDRSERVGAAALAIERRLHEGGTLADAMGAEPGFWSVFELRVVEAGERGGRLPATLKRLAAHFEGRGQMKDRIGYGMIYPIGLVHFAFLVLPLYHIVSAGGVEGYLKAALTPIVAMWLVVLAAYAAVKFVRATDGGRRAIDAIALRIPVLGRAVRASAVLEYATTLGALYSSGIPATECMHSAASATRNAVFSDAGLRAAERLRHGDRMGEALESESRIFPRLLVEAVRLGETTGKLDETLARLEKTMREDVDRWMKRIAAAVPAIAYLSAVVFLGYMIITMFMQFYINPLKDAMNGR